MTPTSSQYRQVFTVNLHALVFMILCVSCFDLAAQIGGKRSFEFLNAPATARLAGLGGVNVSLADHDVNFFYSNPALNGDTLAGVAAANYQFYVGDIGHAAFTWAHNFETIGMLTMGVQHMNYGSIQGFDATGIETEKYNAHETSLSIGKSHQLGNYRLGASIKGIFSNLAGYRAGALAIDIGGVFKHPKQELTIGLTVKNLGLVFSDYSDTGNSKLPFDVQVGASFKPNHMPVRFSITGFNLVSADVTYHDPAFETEPVNVLQQVFTHLNFGGEILVHRHVTILAGYNYFNHQALKLENRGGGAGLSFGFATHVKTFDFVFSRMAYVSGNAAYSFTLSANMNKLLKRA